MLNVLPQVDVPVCVPPTVVQHVQTIVVARAEIRVAGRAVFHAALTHHALVVDLSVLRIVVENVRIRAQVHVRELVKQRVMINVLWVVLTNVLVPVKVSVKDAIYHAPVAVLVAVLDVFLHAVMDAIQNVTEVVNLDA